MTLRDRRTHLVYFITATMSHLIILDASLSKVCWGRSRVKQDSLIKIQVVEAYALLEKNLEQLEDKTKTIENLQDALDELEIRSRSISASTFQAAKTLKEIKEIERAVEDIKWENKSIRVKLSMLNETLITSLRASQVAAR